MSKEIEWNGKKLYRVRLNFPDQYALGVDADDAVQNVLCEANLSDLCPTMPSSYCDADPVSVNDPILPDWDGLIPWGSEDYESINVIIKGDKE